MTKDGKYRILFMEDEHIMRRIWTRYLEEIVPDDYAKLQVDWAMDVLTARECMKVQTHDLLVLDIRINGNSRAGLDFLIELRDSGVTTPVVIYTCVSESFILEELRGRNCITIIPKNAHMGEVHKRIMNALDLITNGEQMMDKAQSMASRIEASISAIENVFLPDDEQI